MRFPDQKFGVVILCNLDTFNPLRLVEQIADIYLADDLAPIETSDPDKTEESAEDTKSEPLAPAQLAGV